MSKEKITELLLAKRANASTVDDFIKLLNNCEMARYSQHHTEASLENDFQAAVQVLSGLDKQIRK